MNLLGLRPPSGILIFGELIVELEMADFEVTLEQEYDIEFEAELEVELEDNEYDVEICI